jgi:hypothetical protein
MTEEQTKINVHLCEDLEIPPHMNMIIDAKVKNLKPGSYTASKSIVQNRILIAESLVQCNNDRIPVMLLNASGRSYKLTKGTMLTSIEPDE